MNVSLLLIEKCSENENYKVRYPYPIETLDLLPLIVMRSLPSSTKYALSLTLPTINVPSLSIIFV